MSVYIKNHSTNEVIKIDQNEFSIGRGLECNHFISSLTASRVHCVIKKEDNSNWILIDKSLNGTIVNSDIVKNTSAKLENNDTIAISDFKFTFNIYPIDNSLDNSNIENTETVNSEMINTNVVSSLNTNSTTSTSGSGHDNKLSDIEDKLHLKRRLSTNNDDDPIVMPSQDNDIMEILDITEDILNCATTVITTTTTTNEPQNKIVKTDNDSDNDDSVIVGASENLYCSICQDLFIKTATLNCSHSFCTYCINVWKERKNFCPICRTRITEITPTLIIDNLIDELYTKQTTKTQTKRKEALKARETDLLKKTITNSEKIETIDDSDDALLISDDDDYDYDDDESLYERDSYRQYSEDDYYGSDDTDDNPFVF